MIKSYIAVFQGVTGSGGVNYANLKFETDEPMSWELLQKVQKLHVEEVNKSGLKLDYEKVIILNVIPLDA